MNLEEAVRELESLRGKIVSFRFHPAGWTQPLFDMHDEVDRVWTDDNGIVYVVFSTVESGIVLRPSQFIAATRDQATWPGGEVHPILQIRVEGAGITLEEL